MKYALVSDIHANAQAWDAVLADIDAQKADAILCLGDVVGYGPEPVSVLESVTSRAKVILLGNHDAALSGMMGDDLFNDDARGIIRWTRDHMSADRIQAIRAWPLVLEADGFSAAHGEFTHPEQFHYIENPEDALGSWKATEAPLLFVGHTHTPGVFVLAKGRIPRKLPPQDFTIEPGRRHLVNIGSVSQARDGDPRSSYCLYDTKTKTVTFRRVAFDYEAHRRSCEAMNLPPLMTGFLTPDPRRDATGRPKIIYFRPAENRDSAAQGAVQKLQTGTGEEAGTGEQAGAAEKAGTGGGRVRRWVNMVSRASMLILTIVVATVYYIRHRGPRVEPPPPPAQTPDVRAAAFPIGKNILPQPTRTTALGEPITGWRVAVGDPDSQSVSSAIQVDGSAEFVLESTSAEKDVFVESAVLLVDPNTKVQVDAKFRPDASFAGAVKVALIGRRTPGGPLETLVAREPPAQAENGWRAVRIRLDLKSQVSDMRLQLTGRFRGRMEVAGVSFMRLANTP